MTDALGPWEPLGVDELTVLMDGVAVPWWFTGGHALELHLGRSWRPHGDIDASIRRRDVAALLHLAPAWELHVAAGGELRPWTGWQLSAEHHENNLWIRAPGGAWCVDVTISDGDDDRWIDRRDPSFGLPWPRAVLADGSGHRYLHPALQLLFKSIDVRPKDDLDAATVIPELDAWSLALLDVRLARHHPWTDRVAEHRRGTTAADVVAILETLDAAGVDAWVDGGWGVDALLGEQCRPHVDLDLALPTRQWGDARRALAGRGFELVRDDGPFNVVMLDGSGRIVDLHAFDDESIVIGDDGVGRHGANGLAYRADGFAGRGWIGGEHVRCMTAEFQMWSHRGYDVDDGDFADVERLHRRFGLAIPDDYAEWIGER